MLARETHRRRSCRGERGQAMVEAALVFPLLLMVAVGLVQLALFYHAPAVTTGAAQDGARVAAAADTTVEDGLARARVLLQAGLGATGQSMDVEGIDLGDAVVFRIQGRLRTVIPWVADATLPLGAQAVISKERFRAGPGW